MDDKINKNKVLAGVTSSMSEYKEMMRKRSAGYYKKNREKLLATSKKYNKTKISVFADSTTALRNDPIEGEDDYD